MFRLIRRGRNLHFFNENKTRAKKVLRIDNQHSTDILSLHYCQM